MILEVAKFSVVPGLEAEFEAAVHQAVPFFRTARGCLSMEIFRSVETPGSYRLFVRWETLENHTVDFRGSDDFLRWRSFIGRFATGPLHVENTSPLGVGF
jgi:heme-degrading monooxygenase HmoA